MSRPNGEERCLILNADYTIIKVIKWETAMKLFYSNKVDIIENYDRYISHPTAKIQVPAVVVLKRYINHRNTLRVRFSSDTLYQRDNYRCGYCNKQFSRATLTKDHIIPRTHFRNGKATGKETSWLNVISACRSCNNKKGGRTPQEAGMQLQFTPYEPKSISYTIKKDSAPKEWLSYIG